MYKIKTSIVLIIIGLASLSSSCDKNKPKEEPQTVEFDRKAMLSNVTTQYILPAYAHYTAKTASFLDNVNDFNNQPSVLQLTALKSSLVELGSAWQTVAFLEFGPAANIGLRSQTNIYPCDTNKINTNIYNNSYDLASAANYAAKGIQAIDYLINRPAQSDSGNVLGFSTNQNASNYLYNLALEINTNAKKVKNEWDAYANDFIENNSSNAQGSAVSDLVNALSAHYETYVRKGKLGIPLGIFNGFSQNTLPEKVELYYGGQSFEMLQSAIMAIEKLINGIGFESNIEGVGLDDYMNFVEAKNGNEKLSVVINQQLNTIKNQINSYNISLAEAVNSETTSLNTLYQSMQKLVPLIKVDLTSALGVLITYQDNDGD